ncbi:hypothetical protein [Rhizobium miluonense]|uniref:Uncharacterized protein n=1 Tax=Rhizobium miluonense TaxID=411945 RepID=A0ABU1SXI6_9HYPH|nr:hypothetical protein [Rhizobium miluonense]MDR6903694.1 hypothetical protein [Rhizobium miluonense]
MEDDVFEMDRLAVDPRRRAGVGEVRALEPSFTDRRTASHLVESGSEQELCEIVRGFYQPKTATADLMVMPPL